MEQHSDAIEVVLPRRDPLRIRDGEGLIVEVVEGCLWLTQEGDSQDHFAKAGQSIAIERAGLTLAFALSAARVRLRKSGAACAPAMEFCGRSAPGAGNARPVLSVPERLRAAASTLAGMVAAARARATV